MQRHFNKKQREALAIEAGFRCSLCRCLLRPGWHADHINPFSKSGPTDVVNGQALCPSCNLKKGDKPMQRPVILRDWQEKALVGAVNSFKNESFLDEDRAFLTQATPGGGKTIHGLSVFDEGRRIGLFTHLVVVAPSITLIDQWQEDAKKFYGIELKDGLLYRDAPDFNEFSGLIMTYQGMNEKSESLRIFSDKHKVLVVADEAHHLSDGASWGDNFRKAFEPTPYRLMVTGTPWTPTQNPIPFVQYGSDGYVETDVQYSKVASIFDGVTRVTEFIQMEARELTFVDAGTGEEEFFETLEKAVEECYPRAYQKTIKSIKHMLSMFLVADQRLGKIRELNGRVAGGLIVAPDIQTAHAFKNEIYVATGIEYPIVHSQAAKSHEQISRFKQSGERWLISVDMVTEGVDIKRLQVCVFLSRAKTELLIRQIIGRIERITSGKDIDRTAFFYYTDHPEINKIVKGIEDENKAGEKLLEEEEIKKKIPEGGCGGVLERDEGFLRDVVTQQNNLIAEGHSYSRDVVAEAIALQNSDVILFDVPLRMICKMIIAKSNSTHEQLLIGDGNLLSAGVVDDTPIDKKKGRIRKVIQQELCSKLGRFYRTKPTGEQIKNANFRINSMIGLRTTNSDTSMQMLEKKLQFISDGEVSAWL